MLAGKVYFIERPILCDTVATVCLTACVTALFSIGGISFNRYLHICHPNLYLVIFRGKNNVLLCILFWFCGFGLSLPGLLGWTDNVYDHKMLECIWNRLHSLSFTIFFSTCIVAAPVCIISFRYISIKNVIGNVSRYYMHSDDCSRFIYTHIVLSVRKLTNCYSWNNMSPLHTGNCYDNINSRYYYFYMTSRASTRESATVVEVFRRRIFRNDIS